MYFSLKRTTTLTTAGISNRYWFLSYAEKSQYYLFSGQKEWELRYPLAGEHHWDPGTKALTKSVSVLWGNIHSAGRHSSSSPSWAVHCPNLWSVLQQQKLGRAGTSPIPAKQQNWEKQWPTCLSVVSSEDLLLTYKGRSRRRCARREEESCFW